MCVERFPGFSKSCLFLEYIMCSKIRDVDIDIHSEGMSNMYIRVITKLPTSEQSYKGKVKTHNYINRQNQSTTGKL